MSGLLDYYLDSVKNYRISDASEYPIVSFDPPEGTLLASVESPKPYLTLVNAMSANNLWCPSSDMFMLQQ